MHEFTSQQIEELEAVLSPPRFATYLRETSGNRHKAMQLYCWNTDIAAAFYVMLQFCELSVRNGAVECLEAEFHSNWHLNRGFALTLRNRGRGYKPREDLMNCAQREPTAGKVVAKLSFAFWQQLFVEGQQARIWDKWFAGAFPGYDQSMTLSQARGAMHDGIDHVRKFRNRIAHHEPIFARDLQADYDLIMKLISWRRPGAAQWMESAEQVTRLLSERP